MVLTLLSELCVRSLHHGEDMIRGKCLFSGLIIQCFFNGLLLVGLGTHDEYAAEAEQDYHVRPPLQAAVQAGWLVEAILACALASLWAMASKQGAGTSPCSGGAPSLGGHLRSGHPPGTERRHGPSNLQRHNSGTPGRLRQGRSPAGAGVDEDFRGLEMLSCGGCGMPCCCVLTCTCVGQRS